MRENVVYVEGLNFDVDAYEKERKQKNTPSQNSAPTQEKKEPSKEEKPETRKNALVSRLAAIVLGSMITMIISFILFSLFGGPQLFQSRYEDLEATSSYNQQKMSEPLERTVTLDDGTTVGWTEYVLKYYGK